MSAALPGPRRQGWRTRAFWPAVSERVPSAGHRGGRDPEGSASHLDVLAPPLPCGIGFAVSVIKARRSLRIIAFRCPRPVNAAPKEQPHPVRLVARLTCAEAPACPDNPLHHCPKAWASRLVARLVHAPGEHFPPWRPVLPCRSIGETFWTPDPFRFHPTRSRERDRPFPGVVSPYRHARFPEGTCACRSVASF